MQTTQTQTIETYYISPAVLLYNDTKKKLALNKMDFKNKKVDTDTYCSELLRLLKLINVPTDKKRMTLTETAPWICNSNLFFYDDKRTTLSRYYKEMINDSLNQIRKGKVAYVYSEDHIKDILRFEPNIIVSYEDGVYSVTL